MFYVGELVKVKSDVLIMPNAKGKIKEINKDGCKVEFDSAPFPIYYKVSELESIKK